MKTSQIREVFFMFQTQNMYFCSLLNIKNNVTGTVY